MKRLLSAGLALAALLLIAALLPVAHARGSAASAPAVPRADRPAWPAWAHSQAARTVSPAQPPPLDKALSVPQRERSTPFEIAGLTRDDTAVAGATRHAEQRLRFAVPALDGRSDSVPAPPPRLV